MTNVEQLVTLFRAFRERNDDAFHKAAEAIIADELAANHHGQARELQKALRNGEARALPRSSAGLSTLPKDRRYGESLISVTQPRIDADRLVLVAPAKAQVERVIREQQQRATLAKYGFRPKTKLLFWGPPGCGKTLTAHWIASELGLPLGVVRLNTLITSFLGETASHIQRVFEMAEASPMVLLIDEADAVAKERDDRNDVGELKRVVNSLLQAMDTFRSTESILIAASNHQHQFDSALWRRFDDIVEFSLPSLAQVRVFFSSLLNGITVSGSIDPAIRSAAGLSFSELEKIAIDVAKTMILEGHESVSGSAVADAIRTYKGRLTKARRGSNKAKSKKNE